MNRLRPLLPPMSYFINRISRRSGTTRQRTKKFNVYSVDCRAATEKLTGFTVFRSGLYRVADDIPRTGREVLEKLVGIDTLERGQHNLHSLVDLSLVVCFGNYEAADFARVGDVSPAVGLRVKALDVDDPDALQARWDEVPGQADEIGLLELLPRDPARKDPTTLLNDAIGFGLDGRDPLPTQILRGEVHPRPVRVDGYARDGRFIQMVDGANQYV